MFRAGYSNSESALALVARRSFAAIVHSEGELYVAECPEVATVSQGKTVEEAVANLQEATQLYLEELPPVDRSRPLKPTQTGRSPQNPSQ